MTMNAAGAAPPAQPQRLRLDSASSEARESLLAQPADPLLPAAVKRVGKALRAKLSGEDHFQAGPSGYAQLLEELRLDRTKIPDPDAAGQRDASLGDQALQALRAERRRARRRRMRRACTRQPYARRADGSRRPFGSVNLLCCGGWWQLHPVPLCA